MVVSIFVRWMADRVVFEDDAVTPAADLYADYCDWRDEHGLDSHLPSRRAFAFMIADMQCPRLQLPDGRLARSGIGLLPRRRPSRMRSARLAVVRFFRKAVR